MVCYVEGIACEAAGSGRQFIRMLCNMNAIVFAANIGIWCG